MTQEEIDRNRAQLQSLAEKRVVVLSRQSAAYAAEEAAQRALYKCREDIWAIREERENILDLLAIYRVADGAASI